jgi:hypothetical protein
VEGKGGIFLLMAKHDVPKSMGWSSASIGAVLVVSRGLVNRILIEYSVLIRPTSRQGQKRNGVTSQTIDGATSIMRGWRPERINDRYYVYEAIAFK